MGDMEDHSPISPEDRAEILDMFRSITAAQKAMMDDALSSFADGMIELKKRMMESVSVPNPLHQVTPVVLVSAIRKLPVFAEFNDTWPAAHSEIESYIVDFHKGDPSDREKWGKRSAMRLLRQARAFREAQEDYGGQIFFAANEEEKRRLYRQLERELAGRKPGPEPTAPEYMIEIVNEWREWKAKGYTQDEFAGFKRWDSRRQLTKAITWYRANFGKHSI